MGIKVGVVGLGWAGQQHAQRAGLHPDAELVAVCDLRAAAAESVGAAHGARAFASVEEMLHATRPEALVVATPPKSHPALTRVAAAMGCHVFVEKPMASTVEGCDDMIAACRDADRVLAVGHKKRFIGAFRRLKELLEGELGAPGFFLYRYPHPYVSEAEWFWDESDGGGPLLENAVHAADLLNWLFGPAGSLAAHASSFRFPHHAPQPNCAAVSFRMESGCIGALGAGMVSTLGFAFEDLYVAAEGGVAEVSGEFDNPGCVRWHLRHEGAEVQEESYPGDPFMAELHDFLKCIRTGDRPVVSGSDGRAAVELALRWKAAAPAEEQEASK